MKKLGNILKKTFGEWIERDPFRQSAVIAYYAIFSLPALLVIVINVAGLFFEREAVSGEINRQVAAAMSKDTAELITKVIEKASQVKAGLLPGIIALVVTISGATGVMVQLQTMLNEIWGVKQKSEGAIMLTVRNRLFSFGLILSIGFLLLVSLVLSSVLASASHWLESAVSETLAYAMYVVEFVLSLSVISALFALMFKFMPDVKVNWRHVWPGALLTGVLFVLGKYGLSLYFGKAEPASVYGAAGSVVLLLLWASYSSMIVFFGAEFTKQYAFAHNAKLQVSKNATIEADNTEGHLVAAPQKQAHARKVPANGLPQMSGIEQLHEAKDKLILQRALLKIQMKDLVRNIFRLGPGSRHGLG